MGFNINITIGVTPQLEKLLIAANLLGEKTANFESVILKKSIEEAPGGINTPSNPTSLYQATPSASSQRGKYQKIPASTPVNPVAQPASTIQQPPATAAVPTAAPQPTQQPAQQPTQQPTQQPPATAAVPTTAPQPAAQPTQQPAQGVPTSTPTYSLDDLAKAASQLMDAGKQQQLFDLLGTFGVQALTQVSPDQYGTFATKLRELGAVL